MHDEKIALSPTVAYIYSKEFEQQLNRLPKFYSRFCMVHQLVQAYGLLNHLEVLSPNLATAEELKAFHSEEYIDFLYKINDKSEEECEENEIQDYGLAYDCPFIPKIFNLVSVIGGATVTAAKALVDGPFQIAVNWGGGWHHAKKDQAQGFCYINDIVLGILILLQKFKRVLYIDLDLHHGDGVEDAFSYTSHVMCVSVHKHEIGFYPGTGSLSDTGFGKGKLYTVNVPLCSGIQDDEYTELVIPVLNKAFESFQPNVVVCQCGADILAGDPMLGFNLTLKSPGECIQLLKSWNVPLLVLGGGGYNITNTARCWTYLLSLLVEKDLPLDIPEHDYIMKYGPDYELHIDPRLLPNLNKTEHLQMVKNTVLENLMNS